MVCNISLSDIVVFQLNGPTVNAPYGGSALARLTLGDLDSGLQGVAYVLKVLRKRDETPWPIYDGPPASA